MLDVTFTPRGPYRLAECVGSPDPTRRFRGGVLDLAFLAGEEMARARVWQTSDGALRARIEAADAAAAHDRLADMLSVDLDPRPFIERAQRDPLLAPIWARARGIRPLRLSSPIHGLVRAITGQLIRSREALAIERAILRHTGAPPTQAALAATHPAVFERAGLSPARAALLRRALRVDWTAEEPLLLRRLRALPGFGPWSVGVVALYGFGRVDHGLAGDLSLVRLATGMLGRRADTADTERLLAPYGDWAGLASLWLIRHPLAGRRTAMVSRWPGRTGTGRPGRSASTGS
jgi:3-methyladenine DNA glycosylase/8-oxoguanine DNA glycosylase